VIRHGWVSVQPMKRTLLTLAVTSLLATTAFAGPIHDAAENGDLAGVQAELDKAVDVNAVQVSKKPEGNKSIRYSS
jgi:hypothetical protein